MEERTPEIQHLTQLYGILAHSTRLQILLLLGEHPCRCVHQISEHTGVFGSSLSHQLRILRKAGLVHAERHGREKHYQLKAPYATEVVRSIEHQRNLFPTIQLQQPAEPDASCSTGGLCE